MHFPGNQEQPRRRRFAGGRAPAGRVISLSGRTAPIFVPCTLVTARSSECVCLRLEQQILFLGWPGTSQPLEGEVLGSRKPLRPPDLRRLSANVRHHGRPPASLLRGFWAVLGRSWLLLGVLTPPHCSLLAAGGPQERPPPCNSICDRDRTIADRAFLLHQELLFI